MTNAEQNEKAAQGGEREYRAKGRTTESWR